MVPDQTNNWKYMNLPVKLSEFVELVEFVEPLEMWHHALLHYAMKHKLVVLV